MIGFPSVLNTRQDYLNAIDYDGVQGRKKLKELREGSWIWVEDFVLSDDEEGIDDDMNKVIVTQAPSDDPNVSGDEIRIQMKLVDDPNSRFYQMGFTLAEYSTLMAGVPNKD